MTPGPEPAAVAAPAAPPRGPSRCHRALWWWCATLLFRRIRVLHPERRPRAGGVCYLALHRNGAVDGVVLAQALPGAEFMVARRLLAGIGRWFFTGIGVVRGKDAGDRSANAAALAACRDHLLAGGALVVFPEGTSTLGPRHLPFKAGAMTLIADWTDAGGTPCVVPVGLDYVDPTAFRSAVEVVIGEPLDVRTPPAWTRRQRLRELRARVTAGLEAVGVNAPDEATWADWQALARLAAAGGRRRYHTALKSLEREVPPAVADRWAALAPRWRAARPFTAAGLASVPRGSLPALALGWLLLTPVVGAALVANGPPLLAGWLAGRRLADDRNVITLWRLLVGVPAFALWSVAALVGTGVALGLVGPLAYVAVTAAGCAGYHVWRACGAATGNALVHPALVREVRELERALDAALPVDAV